MDIDGEHSARRVLPSHVGVYVRRLFTSLQAVGTLKTRLLPALVLQVPRETRLLAEPARAVRAWELLVLANRGRPTGT